MKILDKLKPIVNQTGWRFVVETLTTAPTLASVTGWRAQTAGLVTRIQSTRDFTVNHFAIATNSGTGYFTGDQGALALNAELVIDGHVASDGTVTADWITFGRFVTAFR